MISFIEDLDKEFICFFSFFFKYIYFMLFTKIIILFSDFFEINLLSPNFFFWIKISFYFCCFWAFFTITLYKLYNELSWIESIFHFTVELIGIKKFLKKNLLNLFFFLFGKNKISYFIIFTIDFSFYCFYTVLFLIGFFTVFLFFIFYIVKTTFMWICTLNINFWL